AFVVAYTIIMRFCFHKAPSWGFEMSIFIYGIYFMIAGAEGLHSKTHVKVDIFPSLLSTKGQYLLEILSNIVIIIVCLVITWHGFNMALDSTLIKEHS